MKKIIELDNLLNHLMVRSSKRIHLDIYENEFVTLLGRASGCGKTTH